MKVLLRNPARELDFDGPMTLSALLKRLDLNRESHLVTEDGALVPADTTLYACERCGAPTNNDICSFCALTEWATRPVPLTIGRKPQEVAS